MITADKTRKDTRLFQAVVQKTVWLTRKHTETIFDAALRHCRCPGKKETELMKGLRMDDVEDFEAWWLYNII